MSDDLVKQSLLELQDLVRCRCHPAYTGRGLHDPECECDSAEAVKVVADRIEELSNCIAVLEAKLTQQDDLVQAAILALMGYDAKAAGAKDAGEGFDLAINMALAAIRERGE